MTNEREIQRIGVFATELRDSGARNERFYDGVLRFHAQSESPLTREEVRAICDEIVFRGRRFENPHGNANLSAPDTLNLRVESGYTVKEQFTHESFNAIITDMEELGFLEESRIQDIWGRIDDIKQDYDIDSRMHEQYKHARDAGIEDRLPYSVEQWIEEGHRVIDAISPCTMKPVDYSDLEFHKEFFRDAVSRHTYFRVVDGEVKGLLNEVIARHVHNRLNVVYFNRTYYVWTGKKYIEGTATVKALVAYIINCIEDNCVRPPFKSTHEELMKRIANLNPHPEYPFNNFGTTLPVENGVVDLDIDSNTITFRRHRPEDMNTFYLPVQYDPDACGEPATDLLASWVGYEYVEALYQPLVQAFYQAMTMTVFKKAYITEGAKNAGKTTYQKFCKAIIGGMNWCDVGMADICRGRFAFAPLENKLMNIHDEMECITIDNVERFKSITGGTEHQIEKKFKDAYNAHVTAVHLFGTNKPPVIKDEADDAFYERWIYIEFPSTFDVVPNWEKENLTPELISGAFNEILKRLFYVFQEGKLLYTQTPEEVQYLWHSSTKPIDHFLEECVNFNGPVVACRTLYDKYRLYVEYMNRTRDDDEKWKVESQHRFTAVLALSGRTKHERYDEQGNRYYAYRNAALNVHKIESIEKMLRDSNTKE